MDNSEIHTLLSSFTPIGLAEMDGVQLMNRVEKKYVFSSAKLPVLLNLLSGSYRVLEIGSNRSFHYKTTYLDTSDFLFYTLQVRGKLNRHKIRYRRYEATETSFLEIKKKTNKNRTVKWRIENSLNIDSPDKAASTFIKEYLPYGTLDLKPVLLNRFTRITLVGTESKERITLDYDLTFASPEGKNSEFPFLAIAELKREKESGLSPFVILMKQTGIKPSGFSKYCIGSALIRNMPRKNILKSKLLLINKIENEYINSTGS
jgi:hypothetical protein